MSILSGAVGVEMVKQLFKFGGSFRKEAIGIGTFVPAVVSVYGTVQDVCIESCTLSGVFQAVSGEQVAFLIGSTIALLVHLRSKAISEVGK